MTVISDRRLLFICGHRKCGTTLFADLLDGHPDLCVYPTDIAIFYAYFPHWTDTEYTPEDRWARLDRVVFGSLGDHLDAVGAADRLDVDGVRTRVRDLLSDTDLGEIGTVLEAILAAHEGKRGVADPNVIHVVKETSLEIHAGMLAKAFPNARFIQLIRDPRDNYAALKAGASYYAAFGETEKLALASLLHRYGHGLRAADVNRRTLGPERYMTVRFEDLVRDPEAGARACATFLGVKHDPVLHTPTVLGVPTRGNNFDGETLYTVSSRNAGRWRDRITEREAMIIEFHMAEAMRAWGYDPAFPETDAADAAGEFYRWSNHAFFFRDSYSDD